MNNRLAARMICMVLLVLVFAGYGAIPAAALNRLIADSNCGKMIEVRHIDEDGNPFKGMYEEWDDWLLDHAVEPGDEKIAQAKSGLLGESDELARIWVSNEGDIVPMLEYYRAAYADSPLITLANCPYYLNCIGKMPQDMRAGLAQQMALIRAPRLPPIPGWLAEEPPLAAVFIPGGEIVIFGSVGDGLKSRPDLWPESTESPAAGARYRRYSADGEYLSRTQPDQAWWRLYFTEFDQTVADFGSPTLEWSEMNGFVVFTDPEKVSTFAVYDYRGSKQDDPNIVFASSAALRWVDGGSIPVLYAAQQGI